MKSWQAIDDSPKIRALYYTEMQRENGHPDFEYTRRKFRELDIEEKRRNVLIKKALDRMNHYYDDAEEVVTPKPIDEEANRRKRVEMLLKEEAEIDQEQKQVKTTAKKDMEEMISVGRFDFDANVGENRVCPRCGSNRIMTTAYREEHEAFECLSCHFLWKEPKHEMKAIEKPAEKVYALTPAEKPESQLGIPSTPSGFGFERDKPQRRMKSIMKVLISVLVGSIVTLVGVGIVLWEAYNRLFWTIIFVWFIPIPLIFFGGFFVVLGVIIFLSSLPTFSGSLPTKKKIVAGILVVLISGLILWSVPSIYTYLRQISGATPSHDELLNYALSLINSDRAALGIQNVSFSEVNSAQRHADDMLKYDFFSHWDTSGYKPYMRYTLAGGKGAVAENIAAFTQGAPSDVKKALKTLEWNMINDDAEWNWGHRDNILDGFHNKVSIGISYDENHVYFVQDLVNEYIQWSMSSAAQTGEVALVGSLSKSVSLSQINIFYDSLPSNLTANELEKSPYNGAYAQGTFVGMVLPYGYESTQGITITAQTWIQSGSSFQIEFNLSPAFNMNGKGIYTLYLQSDNQDSLTSYSIWRD